MRNMTPLTEVMIGLALLLPGIGLIVHSLVRL